MDGCGGDLVDGCGGDLVMGVEVTRWLEMTWWVGGDLVVEVTW